MQDQIGTRIAYWRRRRGGMTQAALAGLAGVSQSYISQVESGRKGIERRSTLVAIAAALQVTVADLLAEPGAPTDPVKLAVSASIPAIRAALIEIEDGEPRQSVSAPAELDAMAEHIDTLRAASQFAAMAPVLPGYLLDSASHGGIPLTRACYAASSGLRNLGYRDLALTSARIAVRAAREVGHPGWLGAAEFVRSHAMPLETALLTSRIAERAIGDLQPHAADEAVRQMLGQLHLSAALVCAVDGRADDANAHLAAAEDEARSLGDPADGFGFNQSTFGPTNLALWRMSVDIELGEYGRVIELARTITPDPLRVANRHQAYWMTLGRALAHSGKTDKEALIAFVRAERAAPVAFSLHALGRDAISAMVYRARHRSVSADLRVLARRVGVDVAL